MSEPLNPQAPAEAGFPTTTIKAAADQEPKSHGFGRREATRYHLAAPAPHPLIPKKTLFARPAALPQLRRCSEVWLPAPGSPTSRSTRGGARSSELGPFLHCQRRQLLRGPPCGGLPNSPQHAHILISRTCACGNSYGNGGSADRIQGRF